MGTLLQPYRGIWPELGAQIPESLGRSFSHQGLPEMLFAGSFLSAFNFDIFQKFPCNKSSPVVAVISMSHLCTQHTPPPSTRSPTSTFSCPPHRNSFSLVTAFCLPLPFTRRAQGKWEIDRGRERGQLQLKTKIWLQLLCYPVSIDPRCHGNNPSCGPKPQPWSPPHPQ